MTSGFLHRGAGGGGGGGDLASNSRLALDLRNTQVVCI